MGKSGKRDAAACCLVYAKRVECRRLLQHYNPVIDARVKEIFDIPENFKLVAQMPFGGIVSEPDKKEKEDIDKRVTVLR